jgi:hypothetical protein
MIISGHSDDDVLVDAEIDGGLRNYFLCVIYIYTRTLELTCFKDRLGFLANAWDSMAVQINQQTWETGMVIVCVPVFRFLPLC